MRDATGAKKVVLSPKDFTVHLFFLKLLNIFKDKSMYFLHSLRSDLGKARLGLTGTSRLGGGNPCQRGLPSLQTPCSVTVVGD